MKWEQYFPSIVALGHSRNLTKEDLLTESFLIKQTGEIEMYYAPHNEYINPLARIAIVGITPGWSQMKAAYEQVLRDLHIGKEVQEVLREAKKASSFAGSMRTNLISMLNECGVALALGIEDAASLFAEHRDLIHTTSIIKYPVFYNGKNYTGHQPSIDHVPLLSKYAYEYFTNELEQIQKPALVIPLGKTVETVIQKLLQEGRIHQHTYLFGFPHPSGANGHRRKQFDQNKELLKHKVQNWTNDITN